MKSTDTTEIVLGGRKFDIPCLPFKKNRVVVHACSHALKAINRLHGPEQEPLSLTAIDYIYLAVFEAVSHADPKVTREEFDSWGVDMPVLVTALTKVAIQTGVLVRADKAQGEKASGEVSARRT